MKFMPDPRVTAICAIAFVLGACLCLFGGFMEHMEYDGSRKARGMSWLMLVGALIALGGIFGGIRSLFAV